MPRVPIRKRFYPPKRSKSNIAKKSKPQTTVKKEVQSQDHGSAPVANSDISSLPACPPPSAVHSRVTRRKRSTQVIQLRRSPRFTPALTTDPSPGSEETKGCDVEAKACEAIHVGTALPAQLLVDTEKAIKESDYDTEDSSEPEAQEDETDDSSNDLEESIQNTGQPSGTASPLTFEQRITDQLLRNQKSPTNFQDDIPFSSNEVEQGLTFLQKLRQSRKKRRGRGRSLVQTAQQFLLLQRPEASRGMTGLVIGVDATPNHFGGYCVNLLERTLEYYIVNGTSIPWVIRDRKDSTEFEMKNLLFALSLWHAQIESVKSVSIFTDNCAILQTAPGRNGHNYGEQVRTLIEHFVQCKSVNVLNSTSLYVNSWEDLASFAKFIQPADDLSRKRNPSCLSFLRKLYSIESEHVKEAYPIKGTLNVTPFYEEALNKAKQFASSFNCAEHREDVTTDLKVKIPKPATGRKRKRSGRSRCGSPPPSKKGPITGDKSTSVHVDSRSLVVYDVENEI